MGGSAGHGADAPPSRTGSELARDLFGLLSDPLNGLRHMYDAGDEPIITVESPRFRFCIVRDPDLAFEILTRHAKKLDKGPVYGAVQDVLGEGVLTSSEPDHQSHQRVVAPFFSPGHVARYQEQFDALSNQAVARWIEAGTIDVVHETAVVTITAVLDALFHVSPSAEDRDRFLAAFTDSMETFTAKRLLAEVSASTAPPGSSDAAWSDAAIARLAQHAARAWQMTRRKHHHDIESIHQLPDGMIAEREGAGEQPDDMLTALIDHMVDDDAAPHLDRGQVRDELLSMLLAGHETTAAILTWTIAALSAEGIEYQRHVASDPQAIDQLLYEMLRLYPPPWVLPRFSTEDVTVQGITIPSGTNIMTPTYLLHRSEALFERPNEFDPSRWTPELIAHPPVGYLPFGAGYRACLGRHFVMRQMRSLVHALVTQATVTGIDQMPDEGFFFTLRPASSPAATISAL